MIRVLMMCMTLAACSGSDVPITQANAQMAGCGSDWWGVWQTQTGSWCGIANGSPTISPYTNGPLYAMHTAGQQTGKYAIGVSGTSFAINDNPDGLLTWGLYTECDRMLSAAWDCIGHEIDVANNGNDVPITPYSQPRGNTTALQIGCGSGWPNAAIGQCSAAINVVGNSKTFITGINLVSGAITGDAIALPTGKCIVWRRPDGSISAQLCG